MSYDGSLIFDTKVDKSGLQSGLKTLGSLGATAAATLTAALSAGGAAAIKVGSDFEAAMSQVAAVSGATGAQFDSLTKKAEEMGAKTKFTAAESAEALNYMAMAGWKTEEMLGGIEGIMNLAAASGESLASVSDIVTDAMTAFGLAASDSAHFADVLAAASASSNTNVGMMGATFKYVAPIAGAMKYSIEDTAVAIGLMANAGIKGEQAGTSLRAMLTRMVDPPSDAAAAMDTLNLSIENSNGTMRPLNEILEHLREKFAGMSESQKASTASALAGTEAMSGLLAIVNASDKDFDSLTASIANADGTALKMSETMQDNLKGSLTILSSSLEGLGIAAYDKFADPMKEAVNSSIESINRLTAGMKEGELGKSVDKVAESFGNLLTNVSDTVEDVLPKALGLTAALIDNSKTVFMVIAAGMSAKYAAKAVKGISTITAAWKTATTVMLAHEAANRITTVTSLGGTTLLQTAVGVLTGKVTMLTAAQWALNTAVNALGGPMGVVIAAIGATAAGCAILSIANKKQVDEIDLLTEKIHEEAEAYRELTAKCKEQADAGVAEIDYTKRLWQELKTLVDENGRVIGSKERAKFITEEINKIAPDTIKWISDERIEYEKSAKAIDELMEKKRAQIILDSWEPAYEDAVLNLRKKENEQAEKAIELAEKQLELEQMRRSETPNVPGILRLCEDLEKLQQAYIDNEKIIKEYYNNIAVYEDWSIAIQEGNAKEIKGINNSVGESFKYATSATKEELEKQAENTQVNMMLMQERFRKGYTGVTEDMVREAQKAFVLADAEYRKVGGSSADGFIAGIKDNIERIRKAAAGMGKAATNATKKELDINSPSGVFRDEIGKNMALGLEIGFNNSLDDIYRRMQEAVNAQTSRLSANVLVSTGYTQQLNNSVGNTAGNPGDTIYVTNHNTIDPGNMAQLQKVVKIMDGEKRLMRMGYSKS